MTDDPEIPPPAYLSHTFAKMADAMAAADYAAKALQSALEANVYALEELRLAAKTLGMPPHLKRQHWQPPDPPDPGDGPQSR